MKNDDSITGKTDRIATWNNGSESGTGTRYSIHLEGFEAIKRCYTEGNGFGGCIQRIEAGSSHIRKWEEYNEWE